MNKFLKSLVITALAVSASHVQAHTNKTYLNARSHGVNMALENGGGFREIVMREDKNRFGGNFQAAFFYNANGNAEDTAKYFLFKDKAAVKFLKTNVGVDAGSTADIESSLFVRDQLNAVAANSVTNVKLDPSHTSYGVYFNYFQDLEKIFKGLYFSVNLPVVHIENDLELKVDGVQADNLKGYLNGSFDVAGGLAGAVNGQAKLEKALINGKDSATGIADIDVVLGYRFLDKDTYNAAVNVGLTIPTGNEAEGKRAFEAVYGNGQHFAFGAGLDFGARVWGDHNHNVRLHAAFNYRYLFEASEKRTLGIKDIPFGQYALLGKHGTLADGQQLTPAANVLNQKVDVTPGSQFDSVVNLCYNNGGFVLDGGYNLYFREQECVKLKDAWENGQYAIAQRNFNLSAQFDVANAVHAFLVVNKDQLDASAAQTESQTTHRIYGNFGYIFREWETPVGVGVGAHYEFASNNSALEGWGINVRAGISF